jgi:quinol monooxygenase YgiN
MSDQLINVFYELEIVPGKADELREIVAAMVAFNEEGEPDARVYSVYISSDNKLLTFWETHADNAAMMFHAERFANGSFVGQVLERTMGARLCLYGPVSGEMKAWAADHGFEVEYHELIDGFVR